MASWQEFEAQAPELAAAGWRLLGADGIAIGFLATVSRHGSPHLAPVCPIFAAGNVYLSVGAHTPKKVDLTHNGRFVLHASLGREDEEFQIAGRAREVYAASERGAVHQAIKFGAYNREDPVFLLDIQRCLSVVWQNVGRPDTRAIRKSWSAASGRVGESSWSLAGQ